MAAPGMTLGRNELQRDAVVAVALARWLRTIVEHVTLVAAATRAVILGAREHQLEVGLRAEPSRDRRIEARPSGAALVLGFAQEERQIAPRAGEVALALLG